MGYRSEVCIALDQAASAAFRAAAKLDKPLQQMINDCDGGRLTDGPHGSRLFWSHVKWYDNYPEIQSIDYLLSILPDSSYGMIRIGEDTEDIEEKGWPCEFDIYVTRGISW